MDNHNPIVLYFGMPVVERAVANYFAKHGVNETVREHLLDMEATPSLFLEMVCAYVEKEA
jgi:hypothetical protein